MIEPIVIKAKEGYTFRRISDGYIFSPEVTLGYTYYINGKRLDEPLLELPEHFEEVLDESLIEDEERN